ncbi:MAG: c-type cytochrome [Chitinophagaceae bacterium]|jgi:mono/diheme cytochrome c family protein|nr:c-type cytochrome [Chitinophagaceae bacterium]
MKKWMLWVAAGMLAACAETEPPATETKREIASTNTTHEAGKKLFFGKCASCHMVNKELTGPALKGVRQRWPDQQKLYAFIRNSDSVIQVDSYAKNLWLQYNQTAMTPHPDLTDEQISQILNYIASVSE